MKLTCVCFEQNGFINCASNWIYVYWQCRFASIKYFKRGELSVCMCTIVIGKYNAM